MAEPHAALRLLRLDLADFRTYAALTWRPGARLVALFGANGSGKTNLLEAVSLLVPGRGLRGARIADLPRHGAAAWAVAARFATPSGEAAVATGSPPAAANVAAGAAALVDRRVFRLDGAAPRSQAEIAARIAAVWLTPQTDRLFQEGAAGRRRFLDRLVHALDPNHAREVAAHDAAMAQRNRLLSPAAGGRGRADPAWLAGLEDAMARHGVAATAARLALVRQLNAGLGSTEPAGAFPAARLSLACPLAEVLASGPALAAEDWLRAALAAGRAGDAAAGAARTGAHRCDMGLADAATGLPAAQASTGQQKAMLIGVVLAHAALLAHARGVAPLLLLDEVTVHLDARLRAALFATLRRLPVQALLTGVDRDTFLPLRDVAQGLRTGGGTLDPDPEFAGADAS